LAPVVANLAELGLIDADTLQPVKWDDRQFTSDSDASRDRMRRKRERDREAKGKSVTGDVTSDVTVTSRTVTVTHLDTDTDADAKTDRSKADARSAKRGTRLPADWMPSDDVMAWAAKQPGMSDVLFVNELDKFRDYWSAAAGAKGVKLDWSATFRNWIRNAKGSPNATHSNMSPADRVAANIERRRASESAGFIPAR
jgi:hypothetical protein